MGEYDTNELTGVIQLIKKIGIVVFLGLALSLWFIRSKDNDPSISTDQGGVTQTTPLSVNQQNVRTLSLNRGDDHHAHESDAGEEVDIAEIPPVTKTQVEQILKWRSLYPQSRSQLLAKILEDDAVPQGKNIKPHSLTEIYHRQQGGLKVMALRVLLDAENNPQQQVSDLQMVQNNSTDPTIQAIAKAAEKSVKKGRPFFEDFTGAVARLPIAD